MLPGQKPDLPPNAYGVILSITPVGEAATGGNDGVVRFQKVLEMQKAAGASVPDVTYTYTIVPGIGIGATATSPEVKPGVGTPVVSDVSYTNTDTITQQEVVKTAAITFPEGTFRAPGIYRYVLTESANSNTDITDVDGNVRYLDVYVVNDNVNGGCKIDASVFTEAAVSPTFPRISRHSTERKIVRSQMRIRPMS